MSEPQGSPSDMTAVAEELRDFYDRYPYPRPVESLNKYCRLWQDRDRRRADYHLHWPTKLYREDQSILVAGCGTSQAAKHALRWPAAQVTGIDFSATSVRCTKALKRKSNLNNLQVYQLPIERVKDLEMSFKCKLFYALISNISISICRDTSVKGGRKVRQVPGGNCDS